MGGGIVEKLEAVEDLDSAAPLDAYDTSIDSRSLLLVFDAVDGGGGGGERRRVQLGLDTSVVIRYVHDNQRMKLEG